MQWLKPVRPDDQLTLRATVLETRASKTRPEMGFVTMLLEMINQTGTVRDVAQEPADLRNAGAVAARMKYFEDIRSATAAELGSHL